VTDNFNFANSTTEINKTGTLDLFDSSLGTLNSVTLSLFGGGEMTITLTNTAAQSQSVRATGAVDLIWTSSLAGLNLSGVNMGLTFPTGLQTLAPNQTAAFGPLSDTESAVLTPRAVAETSTPPRTPSLVAARKSCMTTRPAPRRFRNPRCSPSWAWPLSAPRVWPVASRPKPSCRALKPPAVRGGFLLFRAHRHD
jgi:hypothetical protein